MFKKQEGHTLRIQIKAGEARGVWKERGVMAQVGRGAAAMSSFLPTQGPWPTAKDPTKHNDACAVSQLVKGRHLGTCSFLCPSAIPTGDSTTKGNSAGRTVCWPSGSCTVGLSAQWRIRTPGLLPCNLSGFCHGLSHVPTTSRTTHNTQELTHQDLLPATSPHTHYRPGHSWHPQE